MNRKTPPIAKRPAMLIEALEPRIAPAGLLNEAKFTSVTVGGSVLLDASGGAGQFQGLSTAFGAHAGSYLLYLTQGRALVFTTDLNGNGVLDPGEITGIALGKDAQGRPPQLTLFSSVSGDIVTNLTNNGVLSDSDNNPVNGRDGRVLLDTPIAGITLRTLTNADLDLTVPGNTLDARLALTDFSIHGNIYSGGDFGGLSIDDSGSPLLANKFVGGIVNPLLYTGSEITVGSIQTGTAASYHYYHFTQAAPTVLGGTNSGSAELVSNNIAEGTLLPFAVPAGEHGGNISNVSAVSAQTVFSIGTLATGDGGLGTGAGGLVGAPGGNIINVTLHGAVGSYDVIAGNGGAGVDGGAGGSITGFSDLSSLTGQVFLHSGSGGRGVLGTGGVGGTVTLSTANISADLEIVLGNGGAGGTHGGDGASLTNATVVAPDVPRPIGGKIQGTWHDIGDVGDTHPIPNGNTTGNQIYSPEVIDFNGDGIGDVVYSTTNPDQVVVAFGDGFGGYVRSETIILKTPGDGNPVFTVGDFNGDGKPDIAVASANGNNFAGVNIYLNQIGNTTLDPINGNNFTHNPVGDHPFSTAEQSQIPLLFTDGFGVPLYGKTNGITGLAAGDFNGDGITDLAFVVQAEVQVANVQGQIAGILFGEQATSLNTDANVVGAHLPATFVNGSLDNGLVNSVTGRPQGSGFFHANPSPTGSLGNLQLAPFIANTGTPVLHATSISANNVPTVATHGLPIQPELVAIGLQGADPNQVPIQVLTAFRPDPVTHIPAFYGADTSRSFALGQVDTNRALSGATPQVSLQNFVFQDFAIADVDQDGHPDIVPLSSTPQTFVDGYRGDANGFFTRAAVFANAIVPGDNNGIFLGANHPASIAITAVDPTRSGRFDGFAIINLNTGGPVSSIQEFRLLRGATSGDPLGFDSQINTILNLGIVPVIDRQVDAITGFYTATSVFNHATNTPVKNPSVQAIDLFPDRGYAVLAPDISDTLNVGVYFFTSNGFSDYKYLTQNGISLYSGNGGNATNGAGGAGGTIGDGTLNVGSAATTTASISLRYTPSLEYQGTSSVVSGNGGNGFTTGGAGGNISGVVARYNTAANVTGIQGLSLTSIFAGNGGNGVSGTGGNGGSLSSLSIDGGPAFLSGNGGNGLKGGTGGSITGNTVTFDTLNPQVQLVTGFGGQGSQGGGDGGTITKWTSQIDGFGGNVIYTTGSGGSAAGGTGGTGGAITNSPLSTAQDLFSGALQLTSGIGGAGLNGGNGGLINNFVNAATDPTAIPVTLTVLAGAGGIGISGVGGTGGSITGFQSNTIGISSFVGNNQYNGLARIIAGDGGDSYGGAGGNGGSLSGVNATATSTPLVAAAGAGGNGLTAGGTGGSVGTADATTFLNSASQQVGKLLIIAGKGGDAFASLPKDIFLPTDSNTSDLAHAILAFGDTTGVGGNGGSVVNIQQPASVQTAVDIIAGNGGNTPNAGSSTTLTTTVGRGGSISNVIVAGTIGSLNRDTTQGALANPPIKSYAANDAVTNSATTSLTQFVDFLAGDSLLLPNIDFRLDDTIGNVGMVAGAAGTVRGGQPARDGLNGSVAGLTASSVLSIVAGSVDRVVPVTSISNLVLTSPDGVLGADKSINSPFGPNGMLDYYNEAGIDVANLAPGYRLIDGAVFAQSITDTANQTISGPRVFGPKAG